MVYLNSRKTEQGNPLKHRQSGPSNADSGELDFIELERRKEFWRTAKPMIVAAVVGSVVIVVLSFGLNWATRFYSQAVSVQPQNTTQPSAPTSTNVVIIRHEPELVAPNTVPEAEVKRIREEIQKSVIDDLTKRFEQSVKAPPITGQVKSSDSTPQVPKQVPARPSPSITEVPLQSQLTQTPPIQNPPNISARPSSKKAPSDSTGPVIPPQPLPILEPVPVQTPAQLEIAPPPVPQHLVQTPKPVPIVLPEVQRTAGPDAVVLRLNQPVETGVTRFSQTVPLRAQPNSVAKRLPVVQRFLTAEPIAQSTAEPSMQPQTLPIAGRWTARVLTGRATKHGGAINRRVIHWNFELSVIKASDGVIYLSSAGSSDTEDRPGSGVSGVSTFNQYDPQTRILERRNGIRTSAYGPVRWTGKQTKWQLSPDGESLTLLSYDMGSNAAYDILGPVTAYKVYDTVASAN